VKGKGSDAERRQTEVVCAVVKASARSGGARSAGSVISTRTRRRGEPRCRPAAAVGVETAVVFDQNGIPWCTISAFSDHSPGADLGFTRVRAAGCARSSRTERMQRRRVIFSSNRSSAGVVGQSVAGPNMMLQSGNANDRASDADRHLKILITRPRSISPADP